MDKERAKHLGNNSEEGEPSTTPCDDSTQKSSQLFTTPDRAPTLSEPTKSTGDNGQRAKRPTSDTSVKKRNKTANKGEIAFD